jgi:multidrug resistance efflux pump
MDNQEQHLARRRRSSIEEISRLSHAEIQPADFFKSFLGRLMQIFDAEGGSIWVQNNATRDTATALIQTAAPEGMEELQPENVKNVVLRTLDSAKPLLISPDRAIAAHASTEEAYLDYLTLICVPFVIDSESRGCLFLFRAQPIAENFTADDIYHSQNLLTHVSVYLLKHRLNSTEAATKRLDNVVKLSEEFLTTLDVEKVCIAAVNLTTSLAPYDRCSISLGRRGALRVVAITKQDLVEAKSLMARKIRAITERLLAKGEPTMMTTETVGQIEDEKSRKEMSDYFELTGMKCVYAVPLKAGDKTIGLMLFEAYSPTAFDERSVHNMNYVASHTTRALQRASQYSNLPMIRGWEAIGRMRQKIKAMPRHKFYIITGLLLSALLAMIFVPWNYHVSGDCMVELKEGHTIYAPFKAKIKEVRVSEGQKVSKDQVLIVLDHDDLDQYKARLLTSYEEAMQQMRGAQSRNDEADRKRWELKAQECLLEVKQTQHDIDQCELKSPIDGTVVTRKPADLVGKVVDGGEGICQVGDLRHMKITVQLPEDKLSLVREGQETTTTITTFHEEEIKGLVSHVPLESTPGTGAKPANVFLVEVPLDNASGKYSMGLMGKTKVHCGKRRLGTVIFGDIWEFISNMLGL